jgi:hypothetical protein
MVVPRWFPLDNGWPRAPSLSSPRAQGELKLSRADPPRSGEAALAAAPPGSVPGRYGALLRNAPFVMLSLGCGLAAVDAAVTPAPPSTFHRRLAAHNITGAV